MSLITSVCNDASLQTKSSPQTDKSRSYLQYLSNKKILHHLHKWQMHILVTHPKTFKADPTFLKIIGKEFQKNCYKSIFRKINTEEIFFQLTLITNKYYFSRKSSICKNLLSRYMWFISMVV